METEKSPLDKHHSINQCSQEPSKDAGISDETRRRNRIWVITKQLTNSKEEDGDCTVKKAESHHLS